jgi:Kdo2-lipid IVA lauroyltransferase/acyltransferase
MRKHLEYFAAWFALKTLGLLPRNAARAAGAGIVSLAFRFRPVLGRVADFNLRLAFPEWSEARRTEIIRRMVRNIGWMAGEFSQFPKYTARNISDVVIVDGEENYLCALRRGKGVLFLTGHMGAWELSSFAHALYGYPCHFLVRAVDNVRVDALINRYRSLSGCSVIEKNESARSMMRVLRAGGAVGILADQNTALNEGVFVDYFGVPACTTSGLARVALRTGAPVVPGYAVWDDGIGKYRLIFERAIELVQTGNEEEDIQSNTARYTKVVENFGRNYPDQWLWVHKRWKTRPLGENPIYPF